MSTTMTAAQQAERLRRDLEAEDAAHPDDTDHNRPEAFMIAHGTGYGFDPTKFAQLDPGDCGYVIPLRVLDEWAVVVYHYGTGWQAHVGDEIPDWIMRQL